MLNLSQQKEQETICVRTKLSYYKVFDKKLASYRNERNADSFE